jgi:Uma2 family endonuclease
MLEQTITAPADRSRFSLHPEDDMTESRGHSREAVYLEHAIAQARPELFVARNLAVYWVPGQTRHPYAGPDVLVSRHHPPGENPTVYLTYEEGPLTLVAEIVSEKTRRKELRKRDEIYAAALRVPEYLYIDLERDLVQLWRLEGDQYVSVAPDSEGRLWSGELGIAFAWQADHWLVRVLRQDGTIVPTPQEEVALRREAEERAEREARRVEALAAEVERLRRLLAEREATGEGS